MTRILTLDTFNNIPTFASPFSNGNFFSSKIIISKIIISFCFFVSLKDLESVIINIIHSNGRRNSLQLYRKVKTKEKQGPKML